MTTADWTNWLVNLWAPAGTDSEMSKELEAVLSNTETKKCWKAHDVLNFTSYAELISFLKSGYYIFISYTNSL